MSGPETLSISEVPNEIERKFLVDQLPEDFEFHNPSIIQQGYLTIGKDGSETRLRRRDDEYFMTVKSKGSLTRGEIERRVNEQFFEAFWPATEGKRIEKTRYLVPCGPVEIEVDVYSGALKGLISAEIEFTDEITASDFTPPAWLNLEVTYDKRYKNQSLATEGLPLD